MKKLFRNLLLVSASCLVIVSCGKDDDDEPSGGSGGSKTDMLTHGSWQYTNVQAAPPWDIYFNWDSLPACEKDDFVNFSTNGNGTFDEGATKCDPTDPQTSTFKWAWMNSETELQIIEGSDTSLLKQVTISSTSLQGKVIDQGIEITFTWKNI